MIVVKEKSGNIHTSGTGNRYIDMVQIEWHEKRKRILHKLTKKGEPVSLKFLNENPDLKDGDILFINENLVIAVEINACGCIIIKPADMLTTAAICYEIGNRHLPLFYEADELLIPYDVPLYNLLVKAGYSLNIEERKLNNCFQTTVLPHLQVGFTNSLQDSIIQRTNSY